MQTQNNTVLINEPSILYFTLAGSNLKLTLINLTPRFKNS